MKCQIIFIRLFSVHIFCSFRQETALLFIFSMQNFGLQLCIFSYYFGFHCLCLLLWQGSLREHKDSDEYAIPCGDWFNRVSCPHYLAELVSASIFLSYLVCYTYYSDKYGRRSRYIAKLMMLRVGLSIKIISSGLGWVPTGGSARVRSSWPSFDPRQEWVKNRELFFCFCRNFDFLHWSCSMLLQAFHQICSVPHFASQACRVQQHSTV